MTHTIENNALSITVSDHGAELISIYDKENDREVLWQADPAFWNRHAPILFPHVGKHFNNECHYNGKIFPTHQHVFARDMDFSCVAKTEYSVTHRLIADNDTRSYFPFDFSLTVTHSLSGKNITVTWQVENPNQDIMYFTIGGHPAFRVPILPDTKQTDYCLLFQTSSDHLDYLLIEPNSGTAVKEKVYSLPLDHGRAAITSNMFDNDALIFDDSQFDWVGIGYPDGTPYISMSCKGFPNFGIWSLPNAPYICLEPWIGRCDDFGFTEDISKKENIIKLPSHETFNSNYIITIH